MAGGVFGESHVRDMVDFGCGDVSGNRCDDRLADIEAYTTHRDECLVDRRWGTYWDLVFRLSDFFVPPIECLL